MLHLLDGSRLAIHAAGCPGVQGGAGTPVRTPCRGFQLGGTIRCQTVRADLSVLCPAALESLSHAVVLAEPGGFISLFVDLGPPDGRSAETVAKAKRRC